jgi:hypothetical protein
MPRDAGQVELPARCGQPIDISGLRRVGNGPATPEVCGLPQRFELVVDPEGALRKRHDLLDLAQLDL